MSLYYKAQGNRFNYRLPKENSKYGIGLWAFDIDEIHEKKQKQRIYRQQLLKQIQQTQKKKKISKQNYFIDTPNIYNPSSKQMRSKIPIDNRNDIQIQPFIALPYQQQFIKIKTSNNKDYQQLVSNHLKRNKNPQNNYYYTPLKSQKGRSNKFIDEESLRFDELRQQRKQQNEQFLDHKIHEIYQELSSSIDALNTQKQLSQIRKRLRYPLNISDIKQSDNYHKFKLPSPYIKHETTHRRVNTQWNNY